MRAHLVVLVAAAGASFVFTPLYARFVAPRLRAIDKPNARKVHERPTPTSGGIAMFAAVLVGMLVAWALGDFRDLFRTSSEPVGILLAAAAVVLLGAVDDVRGLDISARLAGEVVAAGILVLAGVQLFYFWLPGVGLLSLSTDLSALITVLWTLAVINSVNLIDGLDGLAAGVSAIAAASFFGYAWTVSNGEATTATLLPVIVAGVCIGFLPWNFSPARVFMGDAGSYLLGVLFASATVSGVGRTTEPQFADVAGLIVPVLVPAIVLAIPLADAGFAILRRMRGRRPVFHADKKHIHHWLLEMASSTRAAVLVMYLWSALIAGAALAIALDSGPTGRGVAISLGVGLVATVLVLPRVLRRARIGARESDPIHKVPFQAPET